MIKETEKPPTTLFTVVPDTPTETLLINSYETVCSVSTLLLDLTQVEDENAWADLTVVATQSGDIIEIHGAGEGRPVPKATYQAMLELGLAQIPEMVRRVHGQLSNRSR